MSKLSSLSNSPEQRLAGLRHHAVQQQQATLSRLRAAIEARKSAR
jgi:hypothetical protein